MRKKVEIQKTRVKQTRKEVNSPYWEWLPYGINGELKEEDPRANPDVLSEDNGLYAFHELNIDVERLYQFINNLTPFQKLVLETCGYEGKSFRETAKALGVTKTAVQKTLDAVRKKFLELGVQQGL